MTKLEQSDSDKGPQLMPCGEKGDIHFGKNLDNHSSDKTHIQTQTIV